MPIRSIRKRKSSLTSSLWKVLNVLYEIIFVVQINCNALQQNAMKEAKAIKDNLSVLISQLPARVQQMKVVFSFFESEQDFRLLQRVQFRTCGWESGHDGWLGCVGWYYLCLIIDPDRLYRTRSIKLSRWLEPWMLHKCLRPYLYVFVLMYSPLEKSFLSSTDLWHWSHRFQLFRGGAGDLYLRLTRNGASYDLTKQKMVVLSCFLWL